MPKRHSKFTRSVIAIAIAALTLSLSVASASATTYSIGWHTAVHKITSAGGFTAVSCAAVNECLAVDAAGQVAWSKTPTSKAASAWKLAKIDSASGGLTGISCPLKSFCVAVDAVGNYTFSTDPTGGASKWSKPARIDPVTASGGGYVGLAGVSCASAELCVAVDNAANGEVAVSTNPAAGAKSWRRATIAPGQQLTSISCPSTTLCVAVGTERYYSTDVHGVAADWHAAGAAPGGGVLTGIGCALGSTVCVGVGYDNTSVGLASASAKADSTSWSTHAIESDPPGPTEGLINGVSCPNSGFCVAIDSVDNAYTNNSPASGRWSGPTAVRPGSLSTSAAISCTPRICLVADSRGALTSGSVKS